MQIAHVLAVLISKIARIDYPKEWYVSLPTYTNMQQPEIRISVFRISISFSCNIWKYLIGTNVGYSWVLYFSSRPDLFSFLAQQLQTTDILASHRVTMVLFRTLKELSTKRLSADTRTFSQVKPIKKKR